jgi:hypothetical protein
MSTRQFSSPCLRVGVLAMLLAAPGVGQADIIHRYSFTKDASDSVGTANGVLMGDAFVDAGQLNLDGTPGTYVDLSAIGPDLATLSNTTIEAWVTWVDASTQWQRIFDFGKDQASYVFMTPRSDRNQLRSGISIHSFQHEQTVSAVAQLPDNVEMHVAVVIDSDNGMISLYMNGAIQCTLFQTTLKPSDLGVASNNYLGKSQFSDPFFNGLINEFRIYNVALTADQIATSFAGGPDGTPP